MLLIFQIAIGILIGYLLIEHRQALGKAIRAVLGCLLLLVILSIVVGGTLYVANDTISSFTDFDRAGKVGKFIFSAIGLCSFIGLLASASYGLWIFACLVIPRAFARWIQRFKNPEGKFGTAALVLTFATFVAGISLPQPQLIADWQAAWTEWGRLHGMGGDGGSIFVFTLWQPIWIANLLLLRFREISIEEVFPWLSGGSLEGRLLGSGYGN